MELKPGYKRTEVGIIPEDWEVATLVEVATDGGLVRGPFGGALTKNIFVKSGYKVYEQRNAIYGTTEKGDYYIDASKFKELNRFRVQPGDFIVSCSGTIGSIYRIPIDAPSGVINQALLKITLNEKIINSDFFLAIFRWEPFQENITENAHGGAMQNLVGMDVFKKTALPLPPKAEQEAIAEALSDADTLIESLEQLIAKKRHVKQGAMQELLRPKADWAAHRLGDLLTIMHGKSQHTVANNNGIYPILASGGQIGTANRYIYNKTFGTDWTQRND